MKLSKFIKRLFDLSFSLIIIGFFSPFWLLVALLIKASSSGPIFFVQERPGYLGEIFKVYKFRTMVMGSDTMTKGKEVYLDDPRITKIGRLLRRVKIDEIPQLLNVIKGEMSLVGPRPERISSLKDYTPFIKKRLLMKPGLTGLAQVSGNIFLPLDKRYYLDVFYVEHFSLWLDIKILRRTIGVIFFGEKYYKNKPLI